MNLDTSKWRSPAPLPHQLEGVRALVTHKAFMLGDRPRTMKSRQVVDAACILAERKEIDLVVVIARVAGRGVWGNAKLGQIKKWSWLPCRVFEYHQKQCDLWSDENPQLTWVVTNYDFIRAPKRLDEFLARLSANYKSPMVVFDESHKLGNENSLQAKAAMKICWTRPTVRAANGSEAKIWTPRVARRVMLTGTPGNPLKHWSQFNILDHVLDRKYKSIRTFKWQFVEYSENGHLAPIPGRNGQKGGMKMVHDQVGWKNLDKLSRITAPWALMRERSDCPGLRDVKVQSTFKEVRLSKETWRLYKELKREAITQLSTGETYVTPNKGVCLMRLSQLCNGHLGGFPEGDMQWRNSSNPMGLLELSSPSQQQSNFAERIRAGAGEKYKSDSKTRWLSDEKIDWLLDELREECHSNAVLVWVRFSAQRERLAERLRAENYIVHQIHGGQNLQQRRNAEMIFTTGTERVEGRHVLISQVQAGGDSNDFSAAADVYRLSDVWGDWATFHQSNDRPLGPGQKAEFVSSTDVIACGPSGERSMDHVMLEAREEGRIVEKMSCAEWRKELESE